MKKLLLYLLHSAYLALTAAPVVLYAAASAGAPAWPAMLLLCGASFAGNAVSCFLRERRALFALLAAGLAAAGRRAAAPLSLEPAARRDEPRRGAHGRAAQVERAETELIDARVMVAGLIVCAVVYLMGLFNGLPAVQARVGILAYFYLVASLLLTNRQSVRTNAGGQARRMMRGNQALTWGFLAVLTLVAFFDALREAVGRGIRGALAALLRLIPQGQSAGTTESGGGMGEMDLSGLGEGTPLPEWVQVLGTVILTIVATAALLALAAFVLRALWKGAQALAARLREWMQRFQEAGAEEYSEESEQLLSAESMRREIGRQIRSRVRRALTPPPKWSAMTPNERVRYAYACLLRRQKKTCPQAAAMTPEQLCRSAEVDPAFAALYDRVRYGEGQAAPDEADRWRGAAKP